MSDYQQNFETIIAKYRLSLFKVASTFESDPVLRLDLLQDMFVAVWQALASFQEQSALHTFVYKVAYNQALNHVAKQSKHQRFDELTDNIECKTSDIESNVSALESLSYLTSKIGQLPILQRQLVTLSLEGISYKDMAEISGLSVTNVGVQLNRAKSKLTKLLEKE
ncbi:RNA polymerase sigma factor [Psychrosphaera sp.]|nr:RNA polymerase sigma factor [Psychrosphaera sp.]